MEIAHTQIRACAFQGRAGKSKIDISMGSDFS